MATTAVQRSNGGSGALYDILDLILDKGLVIDVFARVSLVGIELLTVDVRVVIASVDTYLRFAEATNRLDLETPRGKGLSDLTAGLPGGLPVGTDAVGALAGGAGAQGVLSGVGAAASPEGSGQRGAGTGDESS